jgi:hypothetical protein
MSRRIKQDAEAIGSDSFLDVVTNTVGILIVLVMVVGIRAKNLPVVLPSDDAEGKRRVAELAGEAEALERDVVRMEREVQAVTFSAQAKYQERGTFAYLLAEHERELDAAKKTLGGENQASFDVRRALSAAEAELKKLGDTKAEVEKPKKRTPITIKSYPTPISHTVYGKEVHFHLRHGRLAWAPLEEIGQMGVDAAMSRKHLLESGEYSGVVGPRQGFEGQFYVEPLDLGNGNVRGIFTIELVPISDDLGERVDEALQSNSRFRAKLSEHTPRQTTVTLWTYGDSFTDYARIKELLYGLGYQVAARPRAAGTYIGASNLGSHSAAQ